MMAVLLGGIGIASVNAMADRLPGPSTLVGLEPPTEESSTAQAPPVEARPTQGGPPQGGPPRDFAKFGERIPDRTYFAAGYIHEFSADFSDSGSVSVNRGFASAGVRLGLGEDVPVQTSLGLAWSGDWYSFSDNSPLSPVSGVKPWTDIQAIAILSRFEWEINRNWRMFGGVSFLFAGAPSVSIEDSFTAGGNIGVAYAFNRKLRIGGGVLLSSQLEDSLLAIPLLVIYWEIADDLVLSNVLGPETYPTGAGIEFAWRPNKTTELAIGSRYENRRFRLDDSGPGYLANGVGQDTGFPAWIRSTWRFEGGFRLDVVGGVSLFNTYSVDDANGKRRAQNDLDPAPFIGIFGSYRF